MIIFLMFIIKNINEINNKRELFSVTMINKILDYEIYFINLLLKNLLCAVCITTVYF